MNKTKYLQTDSRWSGLGYPKAPWYIRNCGCGEVSICNVIIEMEKYKNYTPATIQPYCKQYAAPNGDGTYWSGIPAMMKHYGLTEVKEHATMDKLWKELEKGDRVAIYLMGSRPGGSKKVHWTSGGHFVSSVSYMYKENKHYVYMKDSASNSSLRNGWITYEENIKGDCLKVWSGKLSGSTPTKYKTIDVSDWQGNIDWKKVKADGVVCAIIRYADGDTLDSKFDKNMKDAKANGIHVGSYIYSRAKTKAEAEKEATRLFNACKPYGCDMPLYIDLEAKGLEKYANTVANAFLDKMKSLGAFAGVYANLNWWNNHLTKVTPPARWVAQYYKKCEYKGGYGMWQYSSDGSVKGISGRVDMDWCYVDYWNKINPSPSPTPTPTPTPTGNTYPGSYPTEAEIKTASNSGTRDAMCSWAKKIADGGKYHYKRWKAGDKKTQECPICKKLTGQYKGWNCIGFAWAAWHHGGGVPSKCDCGVISNDIAEKILKAKTDADATKIAQRYVGINDLKVIRNGGKTIPAKDLWRGDVVLYFKGNTYFHTVLYVGASKISESNTTKPNISYGKKLSTSYDKVAIRYTGGKSYVYKGDRGDAITKLQDYLNWYTDGAFFKECGKADGVYGANTLKYVIKMQADLFGKDEADGTVGMKTIEAMKKVKK